MDATARVDFVASAPNEVSFTQGDFLRIVLLVTEYSKWYWGLNLSRKDWRQGYIPSTYIRLDAHQWYAGRMTEETATRLLTDPSYILPDGTFLVRQSTETIEDYTFEVLYEGKVNHFKILIDVAGRYFLLRNPDAKFASLNGLVNDYFITQHPDVMLSADLWHTHYTEWKPYPTAEVTHDFVARGADELALKKGEVVTIKDMTHNDWWKGYINGKEGIFLASFVKLLTKVGKGLHDFTAKEAGELSFKKGDLVILDTFEGDWWRGRKGVEEGDIAANYVEVLKV